MVTSNETKSTSKPLLILNKIFCRCLTEIKSVWLLISGAGDAVVGCLSDLERFMIYSVISSNAVSEVSCSSSCVSLFFSDSVC